VRPGWLWRLRRTARRRRRRDRHTGAGAECPDRFPQRASNGGIDADTVAADHWRALNGTSHTARTSVRWRYRNGSTYDETTVHRVGPDREQFLAVADYGRPRGRSTGLVTNCGTTGSGRSSAWNHGTGPGIPTDRHRGRHPVPGNEPDQGPLRSSAAGRRQADGPGQHRRHRPRFGRLRAPGPLAVSRRARRYDGGPRSPLPATWGASLSDSTRPSGATRSTPA